MGVDKAGLVLAGETLLERAIRLLHAAGAIRVIVSGARAGYECIPDTSAGVGPAGGITSSLQGLGDGPVVFLPVDMPMLDVESLRPLLAALDQSPAAAYARHPLPLALRNGPDARMIARRLVGRGGPSPSVRELIAQLGGRTIDPGQAGPRLQNINTPDEWSRLVS
jgi:molybdopterin-guanine dinucleotide biosynthesis protein A